MVELRQSKVSGGISHTMLKQHRIVIRIPFKLSDVILIFVCNEGKNDSYTGFFKSMNDRSSNSYYI